MLVITFQAFVVLLGSPPRCSFQVRGGMGWGGEKVSQKVSHVEKAILIKGWEDYPNPEYSI